MLPQSVYTENEARELFVHLMQTVAFLHDQNIVHRDIKVSGYSRARGQSGPHRDASASAAA